MTIVEGVTVAVVVVGAGLVVWRRLGGSTKGNKGSCKACGDECACAIKTIRDSKSSGNHN
jgi:hypothetical protein